MLHLTSADEKAPTPVPASPTRGRGAQVGQGGSRYGDDPLWLAWQWESVSHYRISQAGHIKPQYLRALRKVGAFCAVQSLTPTQYFTLLLARFNRQKMHPFT